MRTEKRSGFTVIELITVISILLLLMGAITTSVTGARRRAMTNQAIAEAQQLTDAILAYENFARPGKDSPLEGKATGESWKAATEGNLGFVLGNEKNPTGQDGNVPVLFNGAVAPNGSILDPWKKPYRYRIMSSPVDVEGEQGGGNMGEAAFAIPNINRIPADEVN